MKEIANLMFYKAGMPWLPRYKEAGIKDLIIKKDYKELAIQLSKYSINGDQRKKFYKVLYEYCQKNK